MATYFSLFLAYLHVCLCTYSLRLSINHQLLKFVLKSSGTCIHEYKEKGNAYSFLVSWLSAYKDFILKKKKQKRKTAATLFTIWFANIA